jgi:predicted negative regulator of RcsB-dependent stress response
MCYIESVKDFMTKLGIAFLAGVVLAVIAIEYWVWRMEKYVTDRMTRVDQSLSEAMEEAMKNAEF